MDIKYLHMDSFTTRIYKCLWLLLYYLASLYEFCMWLRLRTIAIYQWSYDFCHTPAQREQYEIDFLHQCKKYLTKTPKHLNLIIGPKNTQADDKLLKRIFSYALHMNINCVSYYDTRYTTPVNAPKIRLSALEKLNCPKGFKKKDIDAHHSVWYVCKESNGAIHKTNGVVNGACKSSKSSVTNGYLLNSLSSIAMENTYLEIYEIQPEINHPILAKICQDLFKQRHTTEIQNLLKERTLLTERLSQDLSRHLGNITEPELSIVFSEDICTFGMLPWHSRFTEFHQHANGEHFDVKTFARILQKYSRCEQRWGK